jgi:acyl-CoA reductase-like NAD-dependent aldehyde dehydrogenase
MTSTASAGPAAVVDPSSLLTDGAQLIGGQWMPAANGETIDVIDPADGEAGQVTINGFGSRGVIGAPWGGYKYSGFGRTMSAESVLDYTQIKTVVINA